MCACTLVDLSPPEGLGVNGSRGKVFCCKFKKRPEGLGVNGSRGKVVCCKFKKSLYGLCKSPRCWNSTMDTKLREMGFRQTPSDPCMYITHLRRRTIDPHCVCG